MFGVTSAGIIASHVVFRSTGRMLDSCSLEIALDVGDLLMQGGEVGGVKLMTRDEIEGYHLHKRDRRKREEVKVR